ncbi:MAG TPA: RNA polymerase sigma-54 factor, partial [Rhodospirillaceae bacterium]|nr:RNA polymerase sigma-54 factor [Rhodospirillaceae bacterium]
LPDVAQMLGCSEQRVERVLQSLQKFDPPGIFARDLKECLALQLQDRNRFDPAMAALLENLDLLAKQDKSALIKICGVDEEDLTEMVAEVRALDPKPAQNFEQEILQTVTPDILMRPHPDGDWIVELNPETLPRVLVNTEYHTRVSEEARNKDEKDYIAEQFQSANWLVKSLHQRATTILKVAREIVRQQHGFFAQGVEHLRPLILRDIAEAIEMHESTVSRVTSNKYIHTPRGTFELKYFFTSAIGGVGGADSHSAESVRHRIKSLIDEENSDSILSDDGIVAILKSDGIDIARRTVAKYREAMKIPSSVQRRREKNKKL